MPQKTIDLNRVVCKYVMYEKQFTLIFIYQIVSVIKLIVLFNFVGLVGQSVSC